MAAAHLLKASEWLTRSTANLRPDDPPTHRTFQLERILRGAADECNHWRT